MTHAHAAPATWRFPPASHRLPLIIAHRGCSAAYPENTMLAFRAAVDARADGVELDTRLTRDGRVAILHDRRLERTTSGTGVVGTRSLEHIQALDAGSWFGAKFSHARVPSLDEVSSNLPPTFLIDVELKVRGFGTWALVSRVADLIRRHHRRETAMVASFNPLALALFRLKAPRVARGYIWTARHPIPIRNRWLLPLADPQWMNPDRRTLTPRLLERFHRTGRRVLAWDYDGGPDLAAIAATHLDGIIADDPSRWVAQRATLR
ncbi:MAG: hypothetical protein HY261_10995 [Chloroflexi bacterium]|nr:hypothetical protein [Chloroflexota bacterium]